MSKKPTKPTISTPKPDSRRKASKQPVVKLQDVIWTTTEGQTYTRRQLSNKLSRANYKLKQAATYMSPKGFEKLKRDFADVVETAYRAAGRMVVGAGEDLPQRYTDQELFSLKDINDAKAMRALSDAADRILSWERMTKSGYEILRSNQVVAQMQRFHLSEEDAEMLVDLYDSDDWEDFRAAIQFTSTLVMGEWEEAMGLGITDVSSFGDIVHNMVQQHKAAVASDGQIADPFDDPVSWIHRELRGISQPGADEETEGIFI